MWAIRRNHLASLPSGNSRPVRHLAARNRQQRGTQSLREGFSHPSRSTALVRVYPELDEGPIGIVAAGGC